MKGEEIIKMRKALGMTQEKFCKTFGMSRRILCKWEADQVKPIGVMTRLLESIAEKLREEKKL